MYVWVLRVYLFVGGEHMLTALKINVQIVYYVVEFAFFAVGHTHMCVCMCVRVCVYEFWWLSTTQSLEELQDYFLFFFSAFDFYFAFDFTGRFQLVDWESKTFFFAVAVVSISSEFVALLECLLLL